MIRFRRPVVWLLIAVFALAAAGCSIKGRKLRLDSDDQVSGLTGGQAEAELEQLNSRVNGLWTELTESKLTAYLTKRKISPYFKNNQDLTEFIAIYASMFRDLSWRREIVLDYKVNNVTLEPNGVIALVDITVKGRIYLLWYGKLHEVQKWVKTDGRWYLQPQAY